MSGAMVVESSSSLKYESAVVVAEAHFVIVHGRYSGSRRPRRTNSLPLDAREHVVTVLTGLNY
jgi:hypothetical protein